MNNQVGQVDRRGQRTTMEMVLFGPPLFDQKQLPEPKWDDETSQKAYDALLRRIDRREALLRWGHRGLMMAGAIAAATVAYVLLGPS
jgi:hypothetical protein